MKALGACFLIIGTSGYGFYMANKLTERYKQLQELYEMLFMLQGEIRYHNALLEEAFARMANRLEGWRHNFLQNLSIQMEQRNGQVLEELWEKQTEALFMDTYLNREEIQIMVELGRQLGYLDREMQHTTLEFYKERFWKELEEVQEKKEGQCRIYQVLGVAGGMLLTLLFL